MKNAVDIMKDMKDIQMDIANLREHQEEHLLSVRDNMDDANTNTG